MKNETKEILGFDVVVVGIVETLAEAITAAGGEAAVLKDYVSNVLAHSHYSVVRRIIVDTLEKETTIKRLRDKDEKIVEKDAEYIARLESELGEEKLRAYGSVVSAAVEKVPVDYTPGTRGTGTAAAPAKRWLAFYDQLVSEGKLEAFCSKYSVSREGLDEEAIRSTVALKLKEVVTAKEKAAAATALEV